MRKFAFLFLLSVAIAMGLLALAKSVQAAGPTGRSETENACTPCHTQANLSLSLPSGEKLPLAVDPSAIASSVHASLQCSDCHSDISGFPHPQTQAPTVQAYKLSQESVCQTCHPQQYNDVQASVHTLAAEADRVTCFDCHGAHGVQPASSASFRQESVSTCSGCHGNQDLMRKYGVSTDVVKTYLQDFHGKTSALIGIQGQDMTVEEAVCTDCHSAHNIQSVEKLDPNVMKANLVGTCGKCHEGVTQNFPAAWLSHYEPSLDKTPLVFLVRLFYWIMIPFTIIGLLIHILLDIRKSMARKKGA